MDAKIFVDVVAAVGNDFAGIEKVVGIESRFDFGHNAEQTFTNLLRHVFRSRDTDAMLAGEGAIELLNQRGELVAQLAEFFDIVVRVQIQNRANVEESGGSVAVVGSLKAERGHDGLQAANEGG